MTTNLLFLANKFKIAYNGRDFVKKLMWLITIYCFIVFNNFLDELWNFDFYLSFNSYLDVCYFSVNCHKRFKQKKYYTESILDYRFT